MERHRAALRVIAGFDLLANNADRKGGHLLVDRSGHVWAIDNGLSFHVDAKLRTVMWDFAGEELPVPIVAGARSAGRRGPRGARRAAPRQKRSTPSSPGPGRSPKDPRFPGPTAATRLPWPLV